MLCIKDSFEKYNKCNAVKSKMPFVLSRQCSVQINRCSNTPAFPLEDVFSFRTNLGAEQHILPHNTNNPVWSRNFSPPRFSQLSQFKSHEQRERQSKEKPEQNKSQKEKMKLYLFLYLPTL